MPDQSPQENSILPEPGKPSVVMSRWYRNEPQLPNADLGVSVDVEQLGARLKTNHPDRRYPEQFGRYDIAYIASEGSLPIGVLVGKESDKGLIGQWLIVDPEYQGKGIATKLVQEAQKQYPKIFITSSSFGEKKDVSAEEKTRNNKALVEFYKKLGFVIDESSDDGHYESPTHLRWGSVK